MTERRFPTRWFRAYEEIVDDPKVQSLQPPLFKFWMNCMCLASGNGGYLPTVDRIAWRLHLKESQVSANIATLYEKGLLDQEADTFSPHNWQARQYTPMPPAERMELARQRKASKQHNVTERNEPQQDVAQRNTTQPQIQIQNTDTESDTESETDAEMETPPSAAVVVMPAVISEDDLIAETAARLCARHPKPRSCGPAEARKKLHAIVGKLPKSQRAGKLASIDANHSGWCESEGWTKDGGQYAKGLSNWLAPTEGRYDVEPPARASPSMDPVTALAMRNLERTGRLL